MGCPKISVIVPIYNAEKYLEKCLGSITGQHYKNLEIILVNDGSTDKSGDIIEKYKYRDERIITVDKENGGIGSAYKVAFQKMSGDYVSFVDSDDYIDLRMYNELTEIIENNKSDIIQFGMYRFDENGVYRTEIPDNKLIEEPEKILQEHFECIKTPSLACRIFKADLFKSIEVAEQSVGIDEIIYIQLIVKSKSYMMVDKAYYYVYHRQESVSRAFYTEKKIKEGIKAHEFIVHHIMETRTNFIEHCYIKYLKYMMAVVLKASQYKENSEICHTLFRNYKKVYVLAIGMNAQKKEKLTVRIFLRLAYISPYRGVKIMGKILKINMD